MKMHFTPKNLAILFGITCSVLAALLSSIYGGIFGSLVGIAGIFACYLVEKEPGWGAFSFLMLGIFQLVFGFGLFLITPITGFIFLLVGSGWLFAANFAWTYSKNPG